MYRRKTTPTPILETTEGGLASPVTKEILTTISQEATTVFEEYITSLNTSSPDPELGDYFTSTTTSPTMATVPIYQASAHSKPGSITENILESLGGSPEMPMELNMREYDDQEAPLVDATSSSYDFASTVIIIAGSCFVLHKLDKALKGLYSLACYKSDPRLVAIGHRQESFSTRAWARTSTILEKYWIPLWYTGQRMRDAAVSSALDEFVQTTRISNLRREIEDYGDRLAREVGREANSRQLQRERYFSNIFK